MYGVREGSMDRMGDVICLPIVLIYHVQYFLDMCESLGTIIHVYKALSMKEANAEV